MNICIVGARERDTGEDRQLVGQLVEQIAAEAPHSTFISTLTHVGVGLFVKDKCLEKDVNNNYRFAFIECQVRMYARGLSRSDLSQIYLARNASPFEMSDVLIYLASEDRRGTMEELLERFQRAARPFLILGAGEPLPSKVLDFDRSCDAVPLS